MNLKTLWPDTKCKSQNDHQSLIRSSHAPQKSPCIDTERTHSSNFFMSVSSSQGLTSSRTDDLPPAQPKAICQYPIHSFETVGSLIANSTNFLTNCVPEGGVQSHCKDSTDFCTKLSRRRYSPIAKTPQTSSQNSVQKEVYSLIAKSL